MQVELNRKELISWLKAATGVAIVSISLIGQLDKLNTSISSPIKLAKALEQNVAFLNDGPYLVKYEPADDSANQDIPYTSFAMAVTFKTELAQHLGTHIGGYDSLIDSLSSYEYLSKVGQESYGLVGYLLIILPQELNELAALQERLAKYSVVYAFPDGTGTLNLNNVKMGNGVHC